MMFLFFSESGYGSYGHGYGYGGSKNRYHYYGKRAMKKIMASRQRANNVQAELNDDAKIEHLRG